ncbi:unnamed protein product [Effrenium voratum]|uniref:Uncharacterized protein n=1 Tax=Effrenium voratum TaxID=2562239 RepID=A0AA36MQB6_9DINO|nr:unnamed protein product [Effrenium voratum]CAJ1375392.1 unnamed protein product [Effrenium voratum]CAJ1417090.1 unnamed protein product [Effrenium voratum]
MVYVFNPVDTASEFLVGAAVLIALVCLWQYRRNVMIALTGDDKLHGSCLDCIWCCFCQCCGTCTCEWTRNLTMCGFCPRRMRRQNLVKVLGKCLGLSTYTVELRNIVVGDLPFDGRGDIYLAVECAVNPAMKTSVAEDRQGKVIHFPEILTVRVRNNWLEAPVRIKVKQLNLFASEDLCTVTVGATKVISWASDPDQRTKRFQMKTVGYALDRETPPWILVEFGEPTEVRDIENVKSMDTIRTATRDAQPRDHTIAQYKHTYYLLDAGGHAIEEPFEEDLSELRTMRSNATWCWHTCCCGTISVVLLYFVIRSYVGSCYMRFSWLTMAVLNNATKMTRFPISIHNMEMIGQECEAETQGTGLQGVPCRPSLEQVNVLCQSTAFLDNVHQPWPRAWSGSNLLYFLDRFFGEGGVGLRCVEGVCNVRSFLVTHEYPIIGICIFILFSNVIMGWICDCRIAHVKARKLQARQEAAVQFRTKHLEQQQRLRNSWLGAIGAS